MVGGVVCLVWVCRWVDGSLGRWQPDLPTALHPHHPTHPTMWSERLAGNRNFPGSHADELAHVYFQV